MREARVIVEGEIKFDFEITQLTVRAADGTHFCEPIGHVQKDGDYVESWQPQPMSDGGAGQGPRHGGEGHRRAGRAWHFRRRTVRQGRRGLVLGSLAAPA